MSDLPGKQASKWYQDSSLVIRVPITPQGLNVHPCRERLAAIAVHLHLELARTKRYQVSTRLFHCARSSEHSCSRSFLALLNDIRRRALSGRPCFRIGTLLFGPPRLITSWQRYDSFHIWNVCQKRKPYRTVPHHIHCPWARLGFTLSSWRQELCTYIFERR